MNIEKIRSFKDLNTWKEGHKLAVLIYKYTEVFPGREVFGLTNQLRRAAVSITSNIAEGFSRGTYKEKANFYSMALGSLTEVQSQILIAKDVGYIRDALFEELEGQIVIVGKLLSALIKKTKLISQNSKFRIQNSSERGFLALMSAIIISAVLMVVVFSVSFSGFMTRFNILDDEYKIKSYNLAEGYANEAMLRLAQILTLSPTGSATETLNYPSTCTSNCDYYEISVLGGSPNSITIESHSVYQKATTNIRLMMTYSGGSLTLDSWEEFPSL